MYSPQDTIVAVSSPSNDHRVIIRIAGPHTIDKLNRIITPAVPDKPGITKGNISVTAGVNLDAVVYFFRQPHSYTGDDLAEIHLWANSAIVEAIMEKLLSLGTRPAGPGEFTARAYFNNKIDLSQAEAVNEIITASNSVQLAAAQNLLTGRLGQTSQRIRDAIIDCLSQLEARLDFSTEDIEPANQTKIINVLGRLIDDLRNLLSSPVSCESTLDLPAVGIAGAPNAGKSTLLNKLLGRKRSIISHQRKTTRDVLTGELTLGGCRCVLFDCAGLLAPSKPVVSEAEPVEGTRHAETILDELAQQAAIGALQNATVVIFCVDIIKPVLSKVEGADWSEDLAVWNLITPGHLIAVATKTDLIADENIAELLAKLKTHFGCDFLPISAHAGTGLEKLIDSIAERITAPAAGQDKYGIALTARHRQAIDAAIKDIEQTIRELNTGNDEVAAMMLRTAHNSLAGIERHHIDERLLDRIFSRFCIGK